MKITTKFTCVYSEFVSMGRQVPTFRQLFPIPPIEIAEARSRMTKQTPIMAEHICEPSPEELMGELLPKNVYIQIHSALLETSTSEHAAR